MSPDSLGDLLKQVAEKMPLITHDSDTPKSARKVYLSSNKYEAGSVVGNFMRKRMSEGGKIMILVGCVDALSVSERLRGLKEALGATQSENVPADPQAAHSDKSGKPK